MNTGKLFVLSAPSGSGKSTILEHIIAANNNFEFSISVTTRPKRANEINGKDYFFVSKQEFENLIFSNSLLEWEEVYNDVFYGTLKSFVDKKLKGGKNILLDIDVKGALNVKSIYKDKCTLIFIKVSDMGILKTRLINRNTDTREKIEERLEKAVHELSFQNHFDYIVTNDFLDEAVKYIERIVNQEL
jgi:guanylate kinase